MTQLARLSGRGAPHLTALRFALYRGACKAVGRGRLRAGGRRGWLRPPTLSPAWRLPLRAGGKGLTYYCHLARLPFGGWVSLIHTTSWNRSSPKFVVASDPSSAAASTLKRHGATPSASKRDDQVAFVAPLFIKELRLVTIQLPKKSWPIGRRSVELRLDGVLRSWPSIHPEFIAAG